MSALYENTTPDPPTNPLVEKSPIPTINTPLSPTEGATFYQKLKYCIKLSSMAINH